MDVPMKLVECADCGIAFAITIDLEKRLRNCHNRFYCPKGHHLVFDAKTEAEALRDKLKTAEAELNQLRALQLKRIAPKRKQPAKRK